MSTEEKIIELENRIRELETKNTKNADIIKLMIDAIENNANLIGKLTTLIETIID